MYVGERGGMKKTESGLPNAAKFMRDVLRGSTYTFASALADIVDNCIEAEATEVDIWVDYETLQVMVLDNGIGMTDGVHMESMKIASETRDYSDEDLGKYGTGMKAASLSQALRMIVGTKARGAKSISVRCLDMDHIHETNDWDHLTLVLGVDDLPERARNHLERTAGTAVVWEQLDRVFADGSMSGEAAESELKNQTALAENHLAMVFHRFLQGTAKKRRQLDLRINGNKVSPWDPFALNEKTVKVVEKELKVNDSTVALTGYVLPTEKEFSSKVAFANAAGPKKWNESQGFYVYRNERLIRWGGWLRTRASDEHTKLARIALDFTSDLDAIFQVNVAKSSLALPVAIKARFADAIKDVAGAAQKRYRAKIVPTGTGALPGRGGPITGTVQRKLSADALATVLSAVAKANQLESEFSALKSALKKENPTVAKEIGWL